jgi:predicted ATPase
LNVFREDDRGTKAVIRFVESAGPKASDIVHAAFFARWCNHGPTLASLTASQLDHPERLRATLEALPDQPWSNVTAYPIEPIQWNGALRSRLETATSVFAEIRVPLTRAIKGAGGDVVKATAAVNEILKMRNDFAIFMALADLAWFRPDLVDPSSPVPTGIGAVPYLDRLQAHLGLSDHHATIEQIIALQSEYWPDAKRALHPIDVEYLACECRKYFSYVNGTKSFEGKNVFRPGERARLIHDAAAEGATPIDTQIHVVAGGPCSGKTTLLKELRRAGYRVERETAEEMIEAGVASGLSAEEVRADPVAWQREMLTRDYERFENLPTNEVVFTDTSFIEDLVFSERAGLAIGPNTEAWLQAKRYRRVFFLAPLDGYQTTVVRMESADLAHRISEDVRARYETYGYDVVDVPVMPVAERVEWVLRRVGAVE